MRSIHLSVALTLSIASAACVSVKPSLPKDSSPVADSGYVGALCKKETIAGFGFGLIDEQNKDHVIPLENDVGLVALPPGKYHVGYWTTFALTGERLTKEDVPANHPVARPFELRAGQVMVLGRWTADRKMGFGSNTFTLNPIKMSPADAASAVRAVYRGFADAPVACLTCAP